MSPPAAATQTLPFAADSTSFAARIALLNGATQHVKQRAVARLVDAAIREHALHTIRLIAYVRDIRCGQGNTLFGYFALARLATTHPRELAHNLHLFVGVYGRFDDAGALMNTPAEQHALATLAAQLSADLEALGRRQDQDAARAVATSDDRRPWISTCAKWIPSQQSSFERDTQLNKKLSRFMKISPATLRKQYLSPLRAELQLLERLMCARQWDAIDLVAVPSVAMQRHGRPRRALERHLGDRATTWTRSRARGETAKRADWTMPPHKLVGAYLKRLAVEETAPIDPFLEAQWEKAVEAARQADALANTLVLCEVGDGMLGCSKRVAAAVGLLAMELDASSHPLFQHRVLTFEREPQLLRVEGETLCARLRSLLNAPWAGACGLAAALRAVLRVAVDGQLERHEVPATLLVVTDYPLSCAAEKLEAEYDAVQHEFADAGFDVPRLVYWGPDGGIEEAPAYVGRANVAAAQGFSMALYRRVIAGKVVSPTQTVVDIVEDARYAAVALPPS